VEVPGKSESPDVRNQAPLIISVFLGLGILTLGLMIYLRVSSHMVKPSSETQVLAKAHASPERQITPGEGVQGHDFDPVPVDPRIPSSD